MKINIVLVGFMGAGKTLVSGLLAKRLSRKVLSTDDMIVQREGRPVTDIFAREGEAYFRKIEKEAVAQAAREHGVIVDCGGGVVLDPENLAHLKETGVVFYLSATAECIYERIKYQTHRPLLNVDQPKAHLAVLLEKRQAFYEQADYMIDTNDNDWDRVSREIEAIMIEQAR